MYNKSLFDKERLPYPNDGWTWDDFLKAAQELTKRKNGRTVQFGALIPSYYDVMNVVRTFGGDIFNRELTSCILDSPETRSALQFLSDLQNRYKVVPTPGQLGKNRSRAGIQMFMTGRLAMFVAPAFALGALRDIKDFEWDVAARRRK